MTSTSQVATAAVRNTPPALQPRQECESSPARMRPAQPVDVQFNQTMLTRAGPSQCVALDTPKLLPQPSVCIPVTKPKGLAGPPVTMGKNLLPYNVTPPRQMGPTEAEKKIEELTRQLEEEMEKQEDEGEYFGKYICRVRGKVLGRYVIF